MNSSRKRRGETGRKARGQKGNGGRRTGPVKPRGSQGSVPDGDLGSVRERDNAREWLTSRHPGLAETLSGYSADEKIPVIFSEGSRKPDGAGALLGELREDEVLEDGTTIPAGYRIWLNEQPGGGEAPHALRFRDLADRVAGLKGGTGFSPDLAARLARGLGPDELSDPDLLRQIVRGAAGMAPGSAMPFTEQDDIIHDYSLQGLPKPGAIPGKIVLGGDREDGGPGLPHEMQPGDVIADARPLGFTETGIELPSGSQIAPGSRVWRADPVPGWSERAAELDRRSRRLIAGGVSQDGPPQSQAEAEAIRVRTNWTADDVLSQHAWLTHHYRNPGDDLADYLAYMMRDCIRQNSGTTVMFWPVDLRGGPADLPQGRELARLLSRGLGDGRTFQVTAPMVARMRETRDGLAGRVHVLDEGELPCAAGFAWLDAPWLMRLSAGYWLPVRAVSWERTAILASDRGLAVSRDAARVVLWLAIADDAAFGRWDSGKRAEKVANQVGRVVPQHVAILPFGTELNIPAKLRDNGESLLGLLHALWMYLGMTLPKSRPARAVSPAVARRARASLKHGEVHIITLREYDYVSDDPPAGFPGKISWNCRWWVDEFHRHIGHYDDTDEEGRRRRHQAVPAGRTGYVTDDDHDICAVCLARGHAVRIARVRSHAKGPAGKPFRTPAPERTVFKLARLREAR